MRSLTPRMALALLALGTSQAAIAQQDYVGHPQKEALRLIDSWLEASRAYDQVPGLAAGIVDGDRLIWSKGYGTTASNGGNKVTPSTIFSICSISKVFTALSVMQLRDEGRLDIDVSLDRYLPWAKLKQGDPSSGPVTLRGILTHSAGLPREAVNRYWAAPDFPFPSREQLRAGIAGQSMLYRAQEQYQYSNLGISLAGEVVEKQGKEPFLDQVSAKILTPLGMTDTKAPLPLDLYGSRMAIGHGAIGRDGRREPLKPFDTKAITPAAGFVSTVDDLGKFILWNFRVLGTGKTELVSAATLRDMQRVQYVSPDWEVTRGLGFGIYRVDGATYVGHSGECPGYFSSMIMNPAKKTGVVVMMNAAQPTRPYWLGIHKLLNRRGTWSFGDKSIPDKDLEAYAGHYSLQPWGSEAIVVPWGGGLAFLSLPSKDPNGDLDILKPTSAKDVFRRVRPDETEAEEVRFERDSSGKVVRLVWHGNPNQKID